ncbi:MAG: Ldh family oxidoreductase [Chryseobacterium sp.]|nr:MAG: Ldh family oxidoreductase [Chryseobacterium sp.]
MTFSYQALFDFAHTIFLKIGCPKEDALVATKVLLSADMRGIDSHGIARLIGYVRLWEAGRVNAVPQVSIVHETPSTATVDGDRGLGLVVAPYAMELAIKKAKEVGTGWVAVKNSNHFGIAGIHAMMALEEDMIGIALTNASALVAPTFSKERMLGTNPIAVAIPAKNQPAFVADMATTTAANGKLEILQRKKENTPDGWVQDKEGLSSRDANILKQQGALLPLGGDRVHGSHKGYALGSIVDILSGVLGGASYGPWAPPFPAYIPLPQHMPGEGLGHFLGAMRVDAFRSKESFLEEMDRWIGRFRDAEPVTEEQKVLIPGDPERAYEKERAENGIPLHEEVLADLGSLADKFGMDRL